MRQTSPTIRLDAARGELHHRLTRMDAVEKDQLLAALGGPLVARIPQEYGRVPANDFMVAVPLFIDILQSGRVGTIDGLIDGASGTVPHEWLPFIDFSDVGLIFRLPDGRDIHVTDGRIDRRAWDALFCDGPGRLDSFRGE
jgi:hypothetical protein